MPTYLYPFDPTGVLASNKIVNEQHILTSVNSRDYYTIVPKLGPIFELGLVVEYKDQLGNVRPLVKNIDYYLSNVFLGASRACMHPIYGSITLIDNTLSGVLNLKQYQSLGGEWVLDVNKWTQVIASMAGNPRSTTWEQIAGLPGMFPVIDHEWNLTDLVGMKEVVAQLRSISDVILATPGNTSLAAHLLNMGNPHQTTKTHVGLSNVQNYGVASLNDLHEGASDKYITPITLKQRLGELVLSPGNGTPGTPGTNGLNGADGKSAYQVAVANGFAGTEAAWLLSLKGADGGGASGILGGGFKSVTFNTVGSTSWTCPAGVTEIFVTGAGGGGGGGMYSASTGVGGGGAGAAVLKERVTTVPGVTYPIEIGRGGGSGGTGNGIAGGTTSFDWLVVLAGGEGGTTIAGGAGGVRLGVGETVNIFGTGQAPTGDFGGDGGSNHVGGVGCSGGTFMMGQFGAGGSGGNKGLNSSAGGIGFLTIEYGVAEKGDPGIPGPSAYQVAVNNGFAGTEAAWLLSLNGVIGATGPAGSIVAETYGIGSYVNYNVGTDYGMTIGSVHSNVIITQSSWPLTVTYAPGTWRVMGTPINIVIYDYTEAGSHPGTVILFQRIA